MPLQVETNCRWEGRVKLTASPAKPVAYRDEKGYAVIERTWKKGDVVELTLPIAVRQVVARREVRADQDRARAVGVLRRRGR